MCSKGCEAKGCVSEKLCVSKGQVSEGFDVIWRIVCPKLWGHAPLLCVFELCVWSVSWSVPLSRDAPLCTSSRPLYTPGAFLLWLCPCGSLPHTCMWHDYPCVPVTAMTLTCPVAFEFQAANVGPQLDPRGACEAWGQDRRYGALGGGGEHSCLCHYPLPCASVSPLGKWVQEQ